MAFTEPVSRQQPLSAPAVLEPSINLAAQGVLPQPMEHRIGSAGNMRSICGRRQGIITVSADRVHPSNVGTYNPGGVSPDNRRLIGFQTYSIADSSSARVARDVHGELRRPAPPCRRTKLDDGTFQPPSRRWSVFETGSISRPSVCDNVPLLIQPYDKMVSIDIFAQ